jgi:hypothetical protein
MQRSRRLTHAIYCLFSWTYRKVDAFKPSSGCGGMRWKLNARLDLAPDSGTTQSKARSAHKVFPIWLKIGVSFRDTVLGLRLKPRSPFINWVLLS